MKVLKFGAVWCNGCLVMKPRWKEIEAEYPWLQTQYFEYDSEKAAVEQYSIDQNLPTFVFLDKHGKEFLRLSGEVEKSKLTQIILEYKDK